ncbi:hypothetical protein SERLA73DRAFT_134879, partial [Serpula lacrymans var. lacrymans S7.3]
MEHSDGTYAVETPRASVSSYIQKYRKPSGHMQEPVAEVATVHVHMQSSLNILFLPVTRSKTPLDWLHLIEEEKAVLSECAAFPIQWVLLDTYRSQVLCNSALKLSLSILCPWYQVKFWSLGMWSEETDLVMIMLCYAVSDIQGFAVLPGLF